MSKLRKFWVGTFLVLFMMHGILYYLFPDQHYTQADGAGGWIGYLKYLFILAALPALVVRQVSLRGLSFFLLGSSMLFAVLLVSFHWASEGNLLLMQFAMPVLGFFFAPLFADQFNVKDRVVLSARAIIVFTFVMLSLEVSLGEQVGGFSRSGFRGVGPFVNPNNTGIVIALIAVVHHLLDHKRFTNSLIALIALFIITLTGSKTGAFLYLVGLLLVLSWTAKIFAVTFFSTAILMWSEHITGLLQLIALRELSLESGMMRIYGVSSLAGIVGGNSISELFFGFTTNSIIDNAYLDIFSFGGLSLLMPFMAIQFVAIVFCIQNHRRVLLILHLLFFLAMTTTNIPRLWPTGYMYWVVVGLSFLDVAKLRLRGHDMFLRSMRFGKLHV